MTEQATKMTSQEAMAAIWAEVLRLPRVEPDANFFDIGGDSLKAMEVIVRTGEVLQVQLPLMAFFEDPTVAHLADVVDELSVAAPTPPIVRVQDRREFPLSYSQQSLWLLEQQNPGTGIYNTHRVFRIHGAVNAAVLEHSLNELRRRHEILRVRFTNRAEGPVQIVEAAAPLQLKVTDFSALAAEERRQAADSLTLETVRQPFDLDSGQLIRARLIRLTISDSLLCLAMPHAVSDGFTGGILFEELGAIYDALAAGELCPLPEPELHFTDYAAWEQQWIRGPKLEKELEYWRAVLQGAPSSVDLPTDFARSSGPDRSGRLRSAMVPAELLHRIQMLAQSSGTTLFTVLAASLRILFYRWSGQTDFLLGTVTSSRMRTGTERMVGCFVNTLPLRNGVRDGQSVLDLLDAEKNAVMDAFAHQDCPFQRIVEAVKPERTSDDNPLLNVALLLQNFPLIALRGRSFEAEHVDFDSQVALLDLRFIATETSAGLRLSCEYKDSVFSEQTVDTLLRGFAEVLGVIGNDPAKAVQDVAIPEALVQQAKAARLRDHQPSVAIAASFTADSLKEPLNYLLNELGMKYRAVFAPYRQVFQQLLDPTSLLCTADGFGVLLLRFEDWLHGETDTGREQIEKLEQLANELIATLAAARDGLTPVLVCFCPPSRAMAEKPEWSGCFHRLEAMVADAFTEATEVHVVRSDEILGLYPVEEFEDEYALRLGNVPYTADFFSALATMLVRRIWGIAENRYKVIAIDCDQVLWSSRCGEDRQVAPDGPRRALLNCLAEQRDTGMLLCLCSGDREADILAAFDQNPEMPLRRDDFVAVSFNDRPIAENLGELACELGLEPDTFIFLDADPARCSEMEAAFPEVLTLQVPAEPDDFATWLKHVWAFDRRK